MMTHKQISKPSNGMFVDDAQNTQRNAQGVAHGLRKPLPMAFATGVVVTIILIM